MLPVSRCDATKEERLPKIKLCVVNKNERHLSLCFAEGRNSQMLRAFLRRK